MRAAARIAHHARRVVLEQPATLGDGDCEALRDGIWGQPTNTVSSFAFIGSGGWLAMRAARLPRGRRRGAAAYAALVALTGAGSVAYHGPQFPGAQFAHDVPILGALGIGTAVPLWRLRSGRAPLPGWSPALGAALAGTGVLAGSAYLAGRTASPLCRPRSLLQPHGLWHLATAASLGMWAHAVWSTDTDAPRDAGAVPVLSQAGDDEGERRVEAL